LSSPYYITGKIICKIKSGVGTEFEIPCKVIEKSMLVERKAFVRSFVNEVKVTREHVLLNYTILMSPPKLKEEKNPVLDIVQYGGPQRTIARTFTLAFALTF